MNELYSIVWVGGGNHFFFFFINSFVDRNLAYFHILTIVNNASVNMDV